MTHQPRWLPQDNVLVRFRDDDQILHWRGVLRCDHGDLCAVVTPDRDLEMTTLVVGDVYSEVLRMQAGRLPTGTKERDTYLPKHSDKGDFSHDEWCRLAHLQATKDLAGAKGRRRLRGKADELGEVIPPMSDAQGVKERSQAESFENLDAHFVWLVVYDSGGRETGEEISPPCDSRPMVVGGKTFKMFSKDGHELLCREVPRSQLVEYQKVYRMQKPLEKADVEELESDVRILPVLFDAAEERYRTMGEAVPDYTEIEYEDFPLQGPRTVMHDVRVLRRLGLDFLLHHDSWVKKSGVRTTDRSVYEHSSICRALHLMVTYDQLNVPSIAAAEALNRRRALIEHAHAGRPDTPSYEGAEEFLGVKESADGSLVDPALTQHAAKKQSAKAEVMKQTRLAAEEKRHARRGEGDKQEKGYGKGAKGSQTSP